MALKIKTGNLAENIILTVEADHVAYASGVFTRTQKFPYNRIEAILLSEQDGVLSFQVAGQVYKIKVNLDKQNHVDVINAFVENVTRVFGVPPT